jgi:uncharacterized protein (TIGR02145 family)
MKSIFTSLFFALITDISYSQNIGIETTNPKSKLHIGAGDIFLENSTQGLIMKSPDGNCWKLSVNNAGVAVFSSIPCPDSFGTLTYGGQTYATKLMPDGKWWMAENLNIGTMITVATNMTNNNVIEKYCYNNDAANCATYGGLYEWDEMMQYTTTADSQGVCPTGWHLPTDAEWTALKNALPSSDKGSRLAGSASSWIDGVLDMSPYFGTSGFVALPAGLSDDSFCCQSGDAVFWTSTEGVDSSAWYRYIGYFGTDVIRDEANKSFGFSIRCVQD